MYPTVAVFARTARAFLFPRHPMRYQQGGVVSPYLPRHRVVLTLDEVAFCKAHGIRFSDFARHKLESVSLRAVNSDREPLTDRRRNIV